MEGNGADRAHGKIKVIIEGDLFGRPRHIVSEADVYIWSDAKNELSLCERIMSMVQPCLSVESARKTPHGRQYEKGVFPRASYGLGAVTPNIDVKLVFTSNKIAPVKGQVFQSYVAINKFYCIFATEPRSSVANGEKM